MRTFAFNNAWLKSSLHARLILILVLAYQGGGKLTALPAYCQHAHAYKRLLLLTSVSNGR